MNTAIQSLDFHGQPALQLATPDGARAIVSLLGGQVLSWVPAGGEERLYLSEQAVYDGSVSIRGGAPVCFPQFSNLGPLPKHGLVRTRLWTVGETRSGKDFAVATLSISDDEATRALWPHAFMTELTVAVGASRLDIELEVENPGSTDFEFTGALHTYLRVGDVETVRLEGLRGLEYRDAAHGDAIRHETGIGIIIEDEVDRVYHHAPPTLLLREPHRSLGIHSENFPDVVVWNPWEEKCAALSDMPNSGFRRMLCVEAAVAQKPVKVPAGGSWWGRQTLVAM